LLVPTVTLPKSSDVGVTANWPCAVPVPARDIVMVEFNALELTEKLPLALPADCGANVAVKVTLWPAARVSGKLRPLMLNPIPATVACERVTLEPPLLVTASERILLFPT